MFQSTPPHGGQLRRRAHLEQARLGFNPRPRMGGNILVESAVHRVPVSIHAPAWGATRLAHLAQQAAQVSIHAPAWGATRAGQHLGIIDLFQSTPPHGGQR